MEVEYDSQQLSGVSAVFLNAFASTNNPFKPQFVCRCYSDCDIIIERYDGGVTQELEIGNKQAITSCTFFEGDAQDLYLLLASGRTLYITRSEDWVYENSSTTFFKSGTDIKVISMDNKSDIMCLAGAHVISKDTSQSHLMICVGHYDGSVSCLIGTKMSNLHLVSSDFFAQKNTACMKISIHQTGVNSEDGDSQMSKGDYQIFMHVLFASGELRVITITLNSFIHLKFQIDSTKSFTSLQHPMDMVIIDDGSTIAVCGINGIKIFMFNESSNFEEIIFSLPPTQKGHLICTLGVYTDKSKIIIFCADQYGYIYNQILDREQKYNSTLNVVKGKKLYAFPVGSLFNRSKNRIQFYDHYNHTLLLNK